MSMRALGQQFKGHMIDKRDAAIYKVVGPIHRAIIAQGEANQPGIDHAMAMVQQSIERSTRA